MATTQAGRYRARAGRPDQAILDVAWQPGVALGSGLTAYYCEVEAHHRKVADAAYREWEEFSDLAKRYRLLAEKAAATDQVLD